MVEFTAVIEKFAQQGEKTGWTYIKVPSAIAQQLMPGNKKSFRVKGKLDAFSYEGLSLLPMGGGDFILALNAAIRKGIGKKKGSKVAVKMEVDSSGVKAPEELLECLADEPNALDAFQKLTKSHRNYFIKWIETAKTDVTRAKRIADSVSALSAGLNFGEMLRKIKQERRDLLG